jgi:site-specific DNA-cytosine methylase
MADRVYTALFAGGPSIADPRPGLYSNRERVVGWQDEAFTVAGATRPGSGAPSVADPRGAEILTRSGYDHAYGVRSWSHPSYTVYGQGSVPGTGAYSVADPRVLEAAEPVTCQPRAGAYGVVPWHEAAKTITASGQIDNGPFAIADIRVAEVQPVAFIDDPKRSPFVIVGGKRVNVPVVILAEDGTWHRPMTPLELARLQDLPAVVDGAPLRLHGDNVGAWVERIGNAVPVGAARAIAEQMLLTLLSSDIGAGLLPCGGAVWVQPGLEASSQ